MFKKLSGFSLIFVLILVAVAIGVVVYFFGRGADIPGEDARTETSSGVQSDVAPSPFPFMEMTIPGLRDRSYESEFTRMEERSSNSNYTTYFATYDSDGFNLNGMLTRPAGQMPEGGWPAIVFVHGYIPPATYQTFVNYNSYVDSFARAGFVVFKVDLRGHADSEGEASGAYYSGDYIVDVLHARAALLYSDFVKENSVGLWGHSMGGNVIFRAQAARGEIPATVIWAGAVYTYEDWAFGIDDNSYRPPDDDSERARKRRELFDRYGEFSVGSDFWKQVPATNYLDEIKGAVQIHHAVDDNVVGIEYSRNLTSILDGTGKEHQLFEYQNGGHNLTGSTFNTAMQRSVEFFREKLN